MLRPNCGTVCTVSRGPLNAARPLHASIPPATRQQQRLQSYDRQSRRVGGWAGVGNEKVKPSTIVFQRPYYTLGRKNKGRLGIHYNAPTFLTFPFGVVCRTGYHIMRTGYIARPEMVGRWILINLPPSSRRRETTCCCTYKIAAHHHRKILVVLIVDYTGVPPLLCCAYKNSSSPL